MKTLSIRQPWAESGYDTKTYRGVRRLFISNDNRVCFWTDFLKNGGILKQLEKPDGVVWLTCDPIKYFLEKNNEA